MAGASPPVDGWHQSPCPARISMSVGGPHLRRADMSVPLAQFLHRKLRQADQFRTRFADREHQPDGVGRQPPRRESLGLPGRLILPLLVVDHAYQRLLSATSESGSSPASPTRNRSGGGPELRTRSAVPHAAARQLFEPVQHRCAELVQPSEGQLHLRLHARYAHDAAAVTFAHTLPVTPGKRQPGQARASARVFTGAMRWPGCDCGCHQGSTSGRVPIMIYREHTVTDHKGEGACRRQHRPPVGAVPSSQQGTKE
jgi:hypothetical protein